MLDTVAILMATYNGEKYIREQLESLLGQSYKNIEIFISDDGSVDKTIEIIEEYQKIDSRIHLESSNHEGACRNFVQLINNHKEYRYIMLCDQDDVWDTNKIEKMYCKVKEEDDNIPILIYCEKAFVDENLKTLEVKKYKYEDSFKSLLCQCHIYGCTMLLNKALIDLLNIPSYATMHDHWISLVAAANGKIVKLEEELVLYRQHSNNVTGGVNQYSLKNKIRNWKKINNNEKKVFAMCYKFCMQNIKDKVANEYVDMLNSKGIRRLLKAMRFGYRLDNGLATLRALYILIGIKESEFIGEIR